jgi:hypothetical protein
MLTACNQQEAITAYRAIVIDEPSHASTQSLQATIVIQEAYIAGKWQKITGSTQAIIQPTALSTSPSYG